MRTIALLVLALSISCSEPLDVAGARLDHESILYIRAAVDYVNQTSGGVVLPRLPQDPKQSEVLHFEAVKEVIAFRDAVLRKAAEVAAPRPIAIGARRPCIDDLLQVEDALREYKQMTIRRRADGILILPATLPDGTKVER